MSGIIKVTEFLQANPICFLATVDNGAPKVRPIMPMIIREGRVWFSTTRQGNIYRQLVAHPGFQIFSLTPGMASLRMSGEAVFEDNRELKQWGLENRPNLPKLFGRVDNPDFMLFYITNGQAEMKSSVFEAPDVFTF